MICGPLGRVRAEGGKSSVSPVDRVIYVVSNVVVNYLPILLGAFMFLAACFGYGKPPAKWYARLLAGGIGFLLLFLGIRLLIVSN
jgi:hypothetical protein